MEVSEIHYLKEVKNQASALRKKSCRLCLQWTDEDIDGNLGLQNIHSREDLLLKISGCLGVKVASDDKFNSICHNCLQTVFFIDDFRTLCRQTEELFDSVQIQCKDSDSLKRYAECVSVLRQVVQNHKHTISDQLIKDVGCNYYEQEAGDFPCPEFVHIPAVKQEPEEDTVERIAVSEIDIKEDWSTADDSAEDIKKNNEEELWTISYAQQVELAEAVLERLQTFTSNDVNHRKIWVEIADHMGIECSIIETRWSRMIENYLLTKAKATTASIWTIVRLKGCSLFNLMNKIVPELDPNVETWIAPKATGKPSDGTSKSFDFKIALAEEIRNNPELWNTSLNCSTHLINRAWKRIAAQFRMKNAEIRFKWRALLNLYRRQKSREKKGSRSRSNKDEKYYDLMAILEQIEQTKESIETAQPQNLVQEAKSNKSRHVIARKRPKTNSKRDYPRKMTLAKLVFPHQYLWNHKHSEFYNTAKKDAMWDRIAATLGSNRANIKHAWKCLRDLYRGRVKRLGQGLLFPQAKLLRDPLFQLLEVMFVGNMRIGPAPVDTDTINSPESDQTPESPEEEETAHLQNKRNMELALLCEKHPIIWNSRHPDYRNLKKRDIVWQSIASKMNLTKSETKTMWSRLRSVYRNRRLRYAKGIVTETSSIIRDPLYLKLDTMLNKKKNLEQNGATVSAIEEQTTKIDKREKMPFTNAEDKNKLIEEVYKNESLWNSDHRNFHNAVIREKTWSQIADNMNQSITRIKYAYKLLRDSYRSRIKRIKKTQEDITCNSENDPQLKKMVEILSKSQRSTCEQRFQEDSVVSTLEDGPESLNVLEGQNEDVSADCHSDINLKLAQLCCSHEMIWNMKHPDHSNCEKRDQVWDSIAREMNLSKCDVKKIWTKLRNIYRTRRLRYLKGEKTKRNNPSCDPLYRKLHFMLFENMQLGKNGGGFPKTDTQTCAGPFSEMEDQVRLVEEVFKHENLWNTNHVDYFKSDKRRAAWSQVAAKCGNRDVWATRSEWRRLRNLHRPRKSSSATTRETNENGIQEVEDYEEQTITDPLFKLFAKMAEAITAGTESNPAEEGESSTVTKQVKKRQIEEVAETYMTYKRRYKGKRGFDNEGCIRVVKGGNIRYEKVCELCGKQIQRSYFEYHMNLHKGLKPYVCSYEGCSRKYSSKIHRDRHELLIHSEDSYKYDCDRCDKKFQCRSSFDYHYAIKHVSQNIPCNICGKLLKHQLLLREHVKRHSSCFPCTVCGKVLQKKYSLVVHMRKHTKEKPLPCDI